mgnify:CR=1 FL=1
MRVLVCGSRDWTDPEPILRELRALPPGEVVVIHGAAQGADTIAGVAARHLQFRVEVYPADWKRYGRAAGPIRNRQMLLVGRPDVVLAFHRDIDASSGTKDMVRQARRAGVPVRVFAA